MSLRKVSDETAFIGELLESRRDICSVYSLVRPTESPDADHIVFSTNVVRITRVFFTNPHVVCP